MHSSDRRVRNSYFGKEGDIASSFCWEIMDDSDIPQNLAKSLYKAVERGDIFSVKWICEHSPLVDYRDPLSVSSSSTHVEIYCVDLNFVLV